MGKKLMIIGESVHASIPSHGKVMRELAALGEDAFTKDSEQLQYIIDLIKSQAEYGADYIAVNLDEFCEEDVQLAVNMMKEYVKLVREHGKGVPICVDSSNNDVLIAGLKEWYDCETQVAQPLVNSVKDHNIDIIMPLKKDYDFAIVGLLVPEEKGTGPGGMHVVEDLMKVAKMIFDAAVDKYGFKPEEIFFDTSAFPLAIDMPMQPGQIGFTYRAFETIRQIRADERMKNVHFTCGLSNSCRDLPGRKVGIMRAYAQKGMEYGLDSVIANPKHDFSDTPADDDLLKLCDVYAQLDGSPDKLTDAMMVMGDFCSSLRK